MRPTDSDIPVYLGRGPGGGCSHSQGLVMFSFEKGCDSGPWKHDLQTLEISSSGPGFGVQTAFEAGALKQGLAGEMQLTQLGKVILWGYNTGHTALLALQSCFLGNSETCDPKKKVTFPNLEPGVAEVYRF